MVYYTWGFESPTPNFSDEAALMIGQSYSASAFGAGVSDSVTEIFRTAYGTPEWCYDHGNIVGFALYPQHITWDPVRLTYTPNPFNVETFLFTDNAGQASGTTIRQTVSDPIRITNPLPTGLPKDTTQLQSIGTIGFGGVAEASWTDSAIVLPSGCTSSFPVDINFEVKANGVDTPIFINPWDCSIEVDCAHPDTTPPTFHNSFAGCDSIFNDTITAQDNGLYDLGLQDITYASPDLNANQYSVTFNPPPPYKCIGTSAKIFVQQVDTIHSGHVVLTFTDCADNVSRDTICFTAHPPLPDRTAPRFWNVTPADSCHSLCQGFILTDSARSDTSIDRGLDSLVVVSEVNMLVPNMVGFRYYYPPNILRDSLEVCVTDSLKDGMIILRANDTSHNFSYDTITYCTTQDTTPPNITAQPFDTATSTWHVHVTETRSWDRGIDSVWMSKSSNVTTNPALPQSVPCSSTFDFDVTVVDPSMCASAVIMARDCAIPNNISPLFSLSFTKGAIPVIVTSKSILCTATDSVLLSVNANFGGYLWSTGDTTKQITVHKAGIYTVTVDDGVGCSATSQPDTIISSPATPKIAPAGPIAVCAPDSVSLDAGAGFATYQWLNNGNPMPGVTSEKILVTSTGSYSVQVTNAAGCEGTSQPVSVTINPIPTQPVITSANNILTSTPAVSYQWSLNGVPIPGATTQNDTPKTGGNYTVTITDANGCSNTSLPFSNAGSTLIGVPAMVFAAESAQITLPLSILSSTSLPAGVNRSFTAKLRFNRTLLIPTAGSFASMSVSGDDLIVEYTGSSSATNGVLMNLPFTAALGDDSCTGVTIDSFAWSTPNISVTVQNGNFCLSNLCYQGGARLIDPNGTVSLSEPIPNPSTNSIQINYNLIEQGPTTLIIYDVLGRVVLRLVDAYSQPGSYTVSADISKLPAGTYVYTLRTPSIVKSDHLQISR